MLTIVWIESLLLVSNDLAAHLRVLYPLNSTGNTDEEHPALSIIIAHSL